MSSFLIIWVAFHWAPAQAAPLNPTDYPPTVPGGVTLNTGFGVDTSADPVILISDDGQTSYTGSIVDNKAVFAFDDLVIGSSGSISATGSRPLVLLSDNEINNSGFIDVSAFGTVPGPSGCAPPALETSASCASNGAFNNFGGQFGDFFFFPINYEGAGGGGHFGPGGASEFSAGAGGGNVANPFDTTLSGGGAGASAFYSGGAGGGALELGAASAIRVGTIFAQGANGEGVTETSGGGGGAGGLVRVHAPNIDCAGSDLQLGGGQGGRGYQLFPFYGLDGGGGGGGGLVLIRANQPDSCSLNASGGVGGFSGGFTGGSGYETSLNDWDADGFLIGVDCNDFDDQINPAALDDNCDGIDDDCDGAIDEDGGALTFYLDQDGDGFGDPAVSAQSCTAPAGFVTNSLDCDDADSNVSPGAVDDCSFPGVDNDCDGMFDEDGAIDYYDDPDGDGFGSGPIIGAACSNPQGTSANNSDCQPNDPDSFPGAPELCDGIDNDCNANTPEPPSSAFFPDTDGDGFGDASATEVVTCSPGPGLVGNNDDCDDGNPAVAPGATELAADGIDQDCDGFELCYIDGDNDGFGVNTLTTDLVGCPSPDTSSNGVAFDCDDTDASINQGAVEVVADGIDQDCDGQELCYNDEDGDGVGSDQVRNKLDFSCNYNNQSTGTGDCDDTDPARFPGNPEVASNNIDDNCDQLLDCYADQDNDGFGQQVATDLTIASCDGTPGYSTTATDCVDDPAIANASSIYPGAAELCNGYDDNCDEVLDDTCVDECFEDLDEDGFGGASLGFVFCDGAQRSTVPGDCDEQQDSVNPNAQEICGDGVDNDCLDGDLDCPDTADTADTADTPVTPKDTAPTGDTGISTIDTAPTEDTHTTADTGTPRPPTGDTGGIDPTGDTAQTVMQTGATSETGSAPTADTSVATPGSTGETQDTALSNETGVGPQDSGTTEEGRTTGTLEGCQCSSASGFGSWWLVGVVGALLGRRRKNMISSNGA